MKPFLTARWERLVLANYAVAPELLTPHLPAGLTLDRWEGQAWVSLVAFQFRDTKVLGVGWPGYREFTELNLRMYVRQGDRRGVVFLREYVPQRLTATLANLLYNEKYRVAPMRASWSGSATEVTADYRITVSGREHRIAATGLLPAGKPPETSVEHFFKEHEWGFGSTRTGKTLVYRVEHPVWDVYPVAAHTIDLDWGLVYGVKWSVMNGAKPKSVVFAVGSAVKVFPDSVANARERVS